MEKMLYFLEMNQNQITIILCNPEESRNIGSVCRAMANSDIFNLRIVGNKESYNEEQVKTLSVHAYDIWLKAEFFPNLQEAINDCSIAAGTTRRKGKKRKEKLILPEEFTQYIADKENTKIAIIFGNERTGLTDEELSLCTIGITIPTSKTFGSLNLSHAVQIICYEVFRKFNKRSSVYTPVSIKRLNQTVKSITDNLKNIGFFKISGRTDMEHYFRDILSRAVISESEAQYLEKIFTKIEGLSTKQTNNLQEETQKQSQP